MQFALDYVRPDFLMLRVCARSLILWDSIVPSREWVESQLPPLLKHALALTTTEEAAAHIASLQVHAIPSRDLFDAIRTSSD